MFYKYFNFVWKNIRNKFLENLNLHIRVLVIIVKHYPLQIKVEEPFLNILSIRTVSHGRPYLYPYPLPLHFWHTRVDWRRAHGGRHCGAGSWHVGTPQSPCTRWGWNSHRRRHWCLSAWPGPSRSHRRVPGSRCGCPSSCCHPWQRRVKGNNIWDSFNSSVNNRHHTPDLL